MKTVRLVSVMCIAALVLAGCSSKASLGNYSVGPQSHQIRIDAAAGQEVMPPLTRETSAANSVLPGANYTTKLALPNNGEVTVSVSVASGPVPQAHARWIINAFFNNTPERLVTWHGTPADLGVRPCNTPAGSCPGYVGGFQVFRDGVLYNVTESSDSSDTAWEVLHSIRIPTDGSQVSSATPTSCPAGGNMTVTKASGTCGGGSFSANRN